jgi:outer membrane protein OmpA-like peptidoglycan-associated protein
MLNRLLLVLIVLLSLEGQSQVVHKSFYFLVATCAMTEYSEGQFQQLLDQFSKHESHVIEINAFASESVNGRSSVNIAQCFADSILKKLPEQSMEPNIAIYGDQRLQVPFSVLNWNRVDVYYFLGKEREMEVSTQINYDETYGEPEADETLKSAVPNTELPEGMARIIPDKNEILIGVPIVTPVNFVGGKARVTKDSFSYLVYLKNTLQTNDHLNAHIRGHVCCGNKMSISRRRAKKVFHYLKKNGIAPERLSYKGYSNSQPLVYPEKTQEDREANRRVDIIFSTVKK